MFKVAILGCENSHAGEFVKAIREQHVADDVEFVGAFSENEEAAKKFNERFGIPIVDSYDAFVGKIDGVIVVARHGDNHYKYAKPYIKSGIPMFIDKPITIDEDEAIKFMKELKANGNKVVGGSVCIHADIVKELAALAKDEANGKVIGGFIRTPVSTENAFGGFMFYSQHMVQVMCDIFGYDPRSVNVFKNGPIITCVVHYETKDVILEYTEGMNYYYASVSFDNDFKGAKYDVTHEMFGLEFLEFYKLLKGEEQRDSYEDFIKPVFILRSIERALSSGKEEPIRNDYTI